MRAKELRAWARARLSGKWGVAVAVCLVAGLMVSLPSVGGNVASSDMIEAMYELDLAQVAAVLTKIAFISSVLSMVVFVISGAVNIGLCDFFIRLVKGEPVEFKQLFGHFNRLGQGILMNLVISLFTFLWMLLFIIPGIIAAYRYAMVPYLMAEFPDLGVMDAMRESKRLMHGNKWRLFCLGFSFFGWILLGMVTCGIALLWVEPYMYAAHAAFYLEVTGRGASDEQEQPVAPTPISGPEF